MQSTTQVKSFVQAVTTAVSKLPVSSLTSHDDSETMNNDPPQVKTPSAAPLLATLFGWTLVVLPVPMIRKSSAVNLAHARNLSQSRAVSLTQGFPSRESTPAPTTEMSSPPSTPASSQTRPFTPAPSSPIIKRPSVKDAMLQCKMCQRRIGLWAFTPPATTDSPDSPYQPNGARPAQRQLDLIREHRSYCPYVVKSTPLATLPSYDCPSQTETPQPFNLMRTDTSVSEKATSFQKPPLLRSATIFAMGRHIPHARSNSAPLTFRDLPLVEGWRAVFNTVLRYGISEHAQTDVKMTGGQAGAAGQYDVATSEPSTLEGDEDDARKGVSKIVEDVKRHGVRLCFSFFLSAVLFY